MSDIACPSCPSGDGSVFSTVANVAGILTFAYAIAAGLWYYYRSFKSVSRDVHSILNNTDNLQLDAFGLTSDFWPTFDIALTEEGEQLIDIRRMAALTASSRIACLRQLAERFMKDCRKSVGVYDRVRFMLSQQQVVEKAESVSQALETLNSANVRLVPCPQQQAMRRWPLTDRAQLRKVRRVTPSRISGSSAQRPENDA